jgi:hypothetical protein
MLLLEWILILVTFPFWFPIVLTVIGLFILIVGILLASLLFISLCTIIWILKTFYRVHMGLVIARYNVIKEIGNGIGNISWWKLGRLIFSKFINQFHESQVYEKKI